MATYLVDLWRNGVNPDALRYATEHGTARRNEVRQLIRQALLGLPSNQIIAHLSQWSWNLSAF
jgi:hypothetical protein